MNIPYQQLDDFYFNDFVASLHPILQELAVDQHLLKHQEDAPPINTIKKLYQQQYLYMPWLFVDYCPVSDEQLLTLGKAWVLKIIDFVITDNIVDNQAPDTTYITLFHQQLRTRTDHLFYEVMGASDSFWSHYYAGIQKLNNANALEVYCSEQLKAPYTLDVMEELYAGRTGMFSVLIYAMGELSGKLDYVEPLSAYYKKIALADQLLDDAMDWRDDFRVGRYTLPVVMALEAQNIPFEEASSISENAYDNAIIKHEILQQIAQIALDLFAEVSQTLHEMDARESTLADFLQQRIELAEHSVRRYNAMGLLDNFSKALLA